MVLDDMTQIMKKKIDYPIGYVKIGLKKKYGSFSDPDKKRNL